MSEPKTVAGAYAKAEAADARITAHEDLCAERYANIHSTLGEMKGDAKTLRNLGISVLLALLGWMALQLWNGQVSHPVIPAAVHSP